MESGEKSSFIKQHASEIKPLVSDSISLDALKAGGSMTPEQLDTVLEKYETKVFRYERKSAAENSKSLLLEAAQPIVFKTVKPLIDALRADERCGSISLLTDNVAGKQFAEESDSPFHQLRESGKPVFTDIPSGPYDAALIFGEPDDSPGSMLLHSAKSVLGAKKLYYMIDGLIDSSAPTRLNAAGRTHMDEIDAIFATDDFTKRLIAETLHFPEEKIVITGSPSLDQLDIERANEYRKTGRETLAIPVDTIGILYAGFPSMDFKKFIDNPHLNQETYEKTLSSVIQAATQHPEKNYALISRTHPRARGVEPDLPVPTELPKNMTIVSGDAVSYDEAVYAADVIACMVTSSENFLAKYRGRTAAIFGYEHEDSESIAESIYGEAASKIMTQGEGVLLLDSKEKLAEFLGTSTGSFTPIPKPGNSLDRIKEILLEDLPREG